MDSTYSVITAIFADGHREHTVAPTDNVGCFTQLGPFSLSNVTWGEGVERFGHCPITDFDFSSVPEDDACWIMEHYQQIKAENYEEHACLAQ